MYKKTHQYIISAEDYADWKDLVDEADAIYSEHGSVESRRTIQRSGNAMIVKDISTYKSQEDFERIIAEIQSIDRMKQLFAEFQEMVHGEVKDIS